MEHEDTCHQFAHCISVMQGLGLKYEELPGLPGSRHYSVMSENYKPSNDPYRPTLNHLDSDEILATIK